MGQMTSKNPKKPGKSKLPPGKAQKKPTPPQAKAPAKKRRPLSKKEREELKVLEEWEGEEFDTTDFKLLTDESDAE